jgi:ubiquinone/menaquinone biosynthesis C-methylase UbiE
MSPDENKNNPWSVPNAVHFYAKNRQSVDEVYASEEFFLKQVIQPNISILDVGCAAGGFYNIFRSIEPSVRYTGVDFSLEMVQEAKRCFPGTAFAASDGGALPFRAESFDVVYCSGAIHLSPDWRDILRDCWRVTKNHFVFDVRLVETGRSVEDITASYEKIAFFNNWDGEAIVPYIVLNVRDFLHEISRLVPEPVSQQYFGYYRPVSKMAVSPYSEVCMSMCCFSKNMLTEKGVVWNLPIKL